MNDSDVGMEDPIHLPAELFHARLISTRRDESGKVVERIYRGGTVADIADDELLRRVVKSLVRPVARYHRGVPLWSAVMDHFALGSTYAAQLCRRFDFDPDQTVRKPR